MVTWNKDTIKAARELARLSQATFAEQVGVTPMTVHRWEKGDYAPNFDAQRRLDEWLAAKGFTPADLRAA